MQAKLVHLTHKQVQQLSFTFVIFAFAIFIAAILGIFTRPLAYSAFFWPANPVFLGLLIRYPQMRNSSAMLGAFSGYVIADLLTGNSLALTFILTITNFITVLVSLSVLLFLQNRIKTKDGVLNIFPFILAITLGTLTSSFFAINTIPYVPKTFMGTENLFVDFITWWSGEMLNAIIVLPLVIAFPSYYEVRNIFSNQRSIKFNPLNTLPFIAVLVSMVLTHYYFGPGALLYPLATLIWAASVYSLFNIAIINSLVCLTLYHSVSYLYLNDTTNSFLVNIISIRVGLIILGLATIILCIISLNRKQLFKDVYYLANHDTLTETMNRRSFIKFSERILDNKKNVEVGFIMLDIDYFKKLNDGYGHHAGDLVLKKFADTIKQNLRTEDLFCRHGGEEFVILATNVSSVEVHNIAERIRLSIEETAIDIEQEKPIYITASLGVSHTKIPTDKSLQELINIADVALYKAKESGRNKVVMA